MSLRTLFYGLLLLIIIVVFIMSIYTTVTLKDDPEKKSLRTFAGTCIGLSIGMFIIWLLFYTFHSAKRDYLNVENFII